MKARSALLVVGLLVLAALVTTVAYRAGYRHGGDAERACWVLAPTTTAALSRGEVRARRVLKGEVALRPIRNRNIAFTPNLPEADHKE